MVIETQEQAREAGYTKHIECETMAGDYLCLMVKPDADLDGRFYGFCTDENEMLYVNGWNVEIYTV